MSHDTTYDDFAAHLDPVMAVVTVTDGIDHAGCLVGFHGQIGIEPRRHGVWISKENHTFHLAVRAVATAVHLLGPDDHDLARHFGHLSGDDVDKFVDVGHHEGPLGVRLLDRLTVRIAGPCARSVEVGGDHVLLVVEPQIAEDITAGGTTPVDGRGSADSGEGHDGGDARFEPLRLTDVDDIEPGHPDD